MRLRGSDGQTYHTEAELARGGEGVIYTVRGRRDVLIKRYHDHQATPARAAKLRAMLADPPRDEMRERLNHASITWPLALLLDGNRCVGFLMPRIHGGCSLLNAYNPRAKDALRLDWHGQHQVARNLCAALHALHDKGYVVADVNQRNTLVTRQGFVTLVDTDSFQVRAGSTVYRCLVGVPEYTAWDLHGKSFAQVDRTQEHDRFGLAILLFQLLMDGYHPFAGALRNPKDSVPGKVDEWCIRHGIFPWHGDKRFRKPPPARALEALDPGLRDLFVRCFVSGHAQPGLRPAPLEWLKALERAQSRLVRCGDHWRYPVGGPCHVCETRQRTAARQPASTPRPVSRPTPAPPVRPAPQPRPVPAPRRFPWRRAGIAVGVIALLILGPVLYGVWANSPGVLAAAAIAEARTALNRGDEAAAETALGRARERAPERVAEFLKDRAGLYREVADRARGRGETDMVELALAEAARWEAEAAQAAVAKPPVGPIAQIANDMVEIPGGSFQMGCSPGDEACDNDEKPLHPVSVKPFRLGKYEITQVQWKGIMGENPSRFKGDDRPVENVSWNDIQAFLNRLNADNPGQPYRLPTEAEWEYAARGGTDTAYWWGAALGEGNANCDGCGSQWDGKETAPVGSFKPNAFDLYDTVGNVWEWVQDCWHDSYSGAPADGSERRDSCNGARRVLRGGSWYYGPGFVRVSSRYWDTPGGRFVLYGVRLAQDL